MRKFKKHAGDLRIRQPEPVEEGVARRDADGHVELRQLWPHDGEDRRRTGGVFQCGL